MDKIIMGDGDITICEKFAKGNWEDHTNFIEAENYPFKDIELEFKNMQMNLKYYRKETYTNVYVKVDNKKCGWFRFKNGTVTVIKDKLTKKLSDEHYKAYIAIYYSVMYYVVNYKPVLESKEIKEPTKKHKRSNKKESNITYLFNRHYITNPNSTPRKHTPCDHAFKVRGHYRHLKNGKRVWVREYIKGEGKPKEKTFKI